MANIKKKKKATLFRGHPKDEYEERREVRRER